MRDRPTLGATRGGLSPSPPLPKTGAPPQPPDRGCSPASGLGFGLSLGAGVRHQPPGRGCGPSLLSGALPQPPGWGSTSPPGRSSAPASCPGFCLGLRAGGVALASCPGFWTGLCPGFASTPGTGLWPCFPSGAVAQPPARGSGSAPGASGVAPAPRPGLRPPGPRAGGGAFPWHRYAAPPRDRGLPQASGSRGEAPGIGKGRGGERHPPAHGPTDTHAHEKVPPPQSGEGLLYRAPSRPCTYIPRLETSIFP